MDTLLDTALSSVSVESYDCVDTSSDTRCGWSCGILSGTNTLLCSCTCEIHFSLSSAVGSNLATTERGNVISRTAEAKLSCFLFGCLILRLFGIKKDWLNSSRFWSQTGRQLFLSFQLLGSLLLSYRALCGAVLWKSQYLVKNLLCGILLWSCFLFRFAKTKCTVLQ